MATTWRAPGLAWLSGTRHPSAKTSCWGTKRLAKPASGRLGGNGGGAWLIFRTPRKRAPRPARGSWDWEAAPRDGKRM
jgi:hypothetical protein